jgi:hypothetical protein
MNRHHWLTSVMTGLISQPVPTRTETELDKYQLLRMVDVHGVDEIDKWVRNIRADLSGSRVAAITDPRRI